MSVAVVELPIVAVVAAVAAAVAAAAAVVAVEGVGAGQQVKLDPGGS